MFRYRYDEIVGEVVRRIKVSTETVARLQSAEVPVTVVGLSSRDALVLSQEPLAGEGEVLDLLLPTVGGRQLAITSGIGRSQRVETGCATVLDFIVVEQETRSALNDLLRLLLARDGGGERRHPRVVYDVPCRYGQSGQLAARLEDISINGLSLHLPERMAPGTEIKIVIPAYGSDENLTVRGSVIQQRMTKEGGYSTGVNIGPLDFNERAQLARLLADLLCR